MKLTELGYPVVSDEIHKKIFGGERVREMTPSDKRKADDLLNSFGIKTPVDYPENLYDGPLPLPDLKGDTLLEHFESVARDQIGRYKELADELSRCELPKAPTIGDFIYREGWTRYEWDGSKFKTEQVPYPLEESFTFDTETFVKGGAYPVIGTAVSTKACYIWLALEFVNTSLEVEKWDQFKMIPVGTGRFIAGHNISYDRVRTREAYSLEYTEPENFFFDTLSAHVGVSGLASGQRWLYTLADKRPEDITELDRKAIRYSKWFGKGSTNSLVNCYNFHVYMDNFFSEKSSPLEVGDKKIRDVFVVSNSMQEIAQERGKVLDYAMKDSVYTAELFQALWPKYLDSTPTMTALCGHYHLNGSIVPLVDNWKEWIEEAEKVFREHNEEMTSICRGLVDSCYKEWQSLYKEDPEKAERWVNVNPWLKQLDWEVRSTKGKYAHVPNWMRVFIKDPDTEIGVKSRLAHLMLNLEWENRPLVWTEDSGWSYLIDRTWKKVPHPKGTGENVGTLFSKDFVQDMEVGRLSSKLPEAKRALEIANAISYWTSVRKRVMTRITLLASNPNGKDALVTLPEILCHGTVTRRTVENLFVTMCSTKSWRIGTELKTRVVAPDGWKIVGADFDGQEMQVASIYSDKWEGGFIGCSPFGYNVLSGSKESGTDPHTALARAIFPELYQGLIWDKELGVCSVDSSRAPGVEGDVADHPNGPCKFKGGKWLAPIPKSQEDELKKARDLAKVVGFTIIYGGGAKAIQTYIRKVFPDKTEKDVAQFAKTAIKKKKGMLRDDVYTGGSDSGCFNFMEKIAIGQDLPTLPCLGTKISTALRPKYVGNDFKTGRVNWTIQSSGAEILSIILTSVHWLSREYKIPCRFILSIHDEVWFMTPERYAEQFAVLFQIAHMYTWSLFHSRVKIPDLPLSRAYFSSVAIDNRIRKSPKESTISPSNPNGGDDPKGVEYSMTELEDIGAIRKLTTRFNAIKNNLI